MANGVEVCIHHSDYFNIESDHIGPIWTWTCVSCFAYLPRNTIIFIITQIDHITNVCVNIITVRSSRMLFSLLLVLQLGTLYTYLHKSCTEHMPLNSIYYTYISVYTDLWGGYYSVSQ